MPLRLECFLNKYLCPVTASVTDVLKIIIIIKHAKHQSMLRSRNNVDDDKPV